MERSADGATAAMVSISRVVVAAAAAAAAAAVEARS